MGRIYLVAGVPGVGKTTVINGVMEQVKREGLKVKHVVFGDFMLKLALERKLVKHRDEIRKLPLDLQRELQVKAAEEIAKIAKEYDVLLDTHCLIKTREGFWPGLPERVLRLLKLDKIFLIEADPKDIAARRLGDKARERDLEAEEEIKEHQLMNRLSALVYAVFTGASVNVIRNEQGKVNEAVKAMLELIKKGG